MHQNMPQSESTCPRDAVHPSGWPPFIARLALLEIFQHSSGINKNLAYLGGHSMARVENGFVVLFGSLIQTVAAGFAVAHLVGKRRRHDLTVSRIYSMILPFDRTNILEFLLQQWWVPSVSM